MNSKNRKIDINKLISYGFILKDNLYVYEKDICDNDFKLIISFLDKISTKVIDKSFNEEYIMVGSGTFVNKVREEVNNILNDIIDNCTIIRTTQTDLVIKYISDKYKDNLECLWKKAPNDGIFRNKVNGKWYALIMNISEDKLGISSTDKVDVIDLMHQKDKIDDVIDNKKVYPGYHMNKKSWITIKLDDSVDINYIYDLIDNSYNISIKKKNQ